MHSPNRAANFSSRGRYNNPEPTPLCLSGRRSAMAGRKFARPPLPPRERAGVRVNSLQDVAPSSFPSLAAPSRETKLESGRVWGLARISHQSFGSLVFRSCRRWIGLGWAPADFFVARRATVCRQRSTIRPGEILKSGFRRRLHSRKSSNLYTRWPATGSVRGRMGQEMSELGVDSLEDLPVRVALGQ